MTAEGALAEAKTSGITVRVSHVSSSCNVGKFQ